MKEKLGKQIIKNTTIFFIYILTIELIVKYSAFKEIFNYSFLRISISTLTISLIVGTIISLLNGNLKKIITLVISLFIMIYSWVEINLFYYLGFFMGVGNAEQGIKVIDYFKEFISAAKFFTYAVLIPFILITLYYFYIENKLKEKKLEKTSIFIFKVNKKHKEALIVVIIALLVTLLSYGYSKSLKIKFMQNNLQSIKNEVLFKYPENSNLSVSQFGILMYGITDLKANILKYEYLPEDIYASNHNNITNQEIDNKRIIDDTLWNNVILNETSQRYKNLNTYFINREITPKNDYTGLFEGKNLIMILMESVNEIAINEELFPNIYKLYDEGISFTNHYSPRNSCATGNNEFTSLTSLHSINNTCTANTYRNNKYPESIFNMFNELGYYTSSYHNYSDAYYSRRVIHPNLGSQSYKNVADLGIKWSGKYEEWPSDTLLIENSLEHFIDKDKFMTYLITVTTHQPFGVNSEFGNKHLDKLEDYDYNIQLKRYLSKMLELDEALGILLNSLKEYKKLDDTVIVLFGDHYPYGLSNNILSEIIDHDLENNEVDRTPFIIYNSNSKEEKINKYTSIIDIAPTLLNLFNIDYDPRLYLGNDLFSDKEGIAIFSDGSWKNEYGFYSSTKGRFIYNEGSTKTYTIEELIEINNDINVKQKMSSLAIRNNYFDYLNNAKLKYKEINKEEDL